MDTPCAGSLGIANGCNNSRADGSRGSGSSFEPVIYVKDPRADGSRGVDLHSESATYVTNLQDVNGSCGTDAVSYVSESQPGGAAAAGKIISNNTREGVLGDGEVALASSPSRGGAESAGSSGYGQARTQKT